MVFTMDLTISENSEIFDRKSIAALFTGYTFLPGRYEKSHLKLILKSLLPYDVKINITIDDSRPRSIFTMNKTEKFSEKSFFSSISGFTQSHSGALGDNEGFVRISNDTRIIQKWKPIGLAWIEKVHIMWLHQWKHWLWYSRTHYE